MSDLYPGFNANDEPAIYAVLAALLANPDPPRAVVDRVDLGPSGMPYAEVASSFGYRLGLRGTPHTDVGQHTGYHVWYCCVRLNRTVPVHERSFFGGGSADYEAPWEQFSCIAGDPQYRPGGTLDRWRDLYDAAYAALVP